MKTLIFHSLETLSAKKLALELGGEVELRKNHYRIHTKKDFDIENCHYCPVIISSRLGMAALAPCRAT